LSWDRGVVMVSVSFLGDGKKRGSHAVEVGELPR
jgi:hypothetical protein